MRDIPFNVSARTARLIGRENVSSAEGALIELVKNSYDADAKICIVYFDNLYAEIPQRVSSVNYQAFRDLWEAQDICFLEGFYLLDEAADSYVFQEEEYRRALKPDERAAIERKLLGKAVIHVVDDGDGMTEDTIERSWMTIGTDNKNLDFVSTATGRVKSGAKGIGRFALDRLGEQCELFTKTVGPSEALLWKVDWSDFDKQGITIDGVNAKIGPAPISLQASLKEILSGCGTSPVENLELHKGTHIKISQVRDSWRRPEVVKIYNELESLVPPVEAGDFKIYVYSRRDNGDFGEVLPNICEDYDYKFSAVMDSDGDISIEVIRHELDPTRLSEELLKRVFFSNPDYSRAKLCGEPLRYKKTLYELLPGLAEANPSAHGEIGPFRLTLYFLKRSSNGKDTDVYLHRSFDSDSRKRWLDNNNGVRIFRDNFRVRPYGEIGKPSWDWLGLGRRQAEDPSALRTGRWKVTPNNLSGVINISRISNLRLEDKSSREGIQENTTFSLFRSVIEALVKEFENDRSSLYKEIYSYHQDKKNTPTDDELNPQQEEDAERIAQQIFDDIKKEQKEAQDDSAKLALALLKEKARAREIDDRLEEMRKENSLLRVFASSGITIASFTHELDSLNAKLGNRFDQLESLFRDFVDMSIADRRGIPDFKSPYKRILMLKRDDERVKNWIKYSLRTIRKDKRKRVKINLKSYLENLRDEWSATLAERQVAITVDIADPSLSIRAYEIDLDCIFNNLIINSADAFKRPGFSGRRNILIRAHADGRMIGFSYRDSGPGLSSDITEPADIFQPTFTTKKNSLGEEIGTGLGMWLVDKTIDEYGGKVAIQMGAPGFSLIMELKSE
jgi:signal transduction histidine kinase